MGSSAFRGKLIENVLVQQLDKPVSRTASTVLYNGSAATTGVAVDGMGFDEVLFVLNKGAVASGAVVVATIVGNTTDDPATATAITGAAFTTLGNANQNTLEVISIQSKDQNRYMWLKTDKTDVAGNAALWSAEAIKKTKEAASTSTSNVKADV